MTLQEVTDTMKDFSFSIDEKIESATTDYWKAYYKGYKQSLEDCIDHFTGGIEKE